MPTPRTGSEYKLNENFRVNVIATEEEHDRTIEIVTIPGKSYYLPVVSSKAVNSSIHGF